MLANETPIYLAAERLIGAVIDIVPNFPKCHRALGERLETMTIDALSYIQLAYRYRDSQEQKRKHLMSFSMAMERIKTVIRVCAEKKVLTTKQSARLASLTESIGRQTSAWYK